MRYKYFIYLFLFTLSPLASALPKIAIAYNKTAEGFMRTQIKNETLEQLACYVAIDGFKRKYQLRPRSTSRWFTATDTKFNYTDFKIWCDYLEVHPKYRAYQAY